jgi:hypothetical protein
MDRFIVQFKSANVPYWCGNGPLHVSLSKAQREARQLDGLGVSWRVLNTQSRQVLSSKVVSH